MVMAAGQDVMNVLKVGLEDLLEGFETEYRRFQNGLGVRNQRWGFATNDQRSYNTERIIKLRGIDPKGA